MLLRIPPQPPVIPDHHKNGAEALVEIDRAPRGIKLERCTVSHRVAADDRPYRIIVTLHRTRQMIGPCAPECIVPIPATSQPHDTNEKPKARRRHQ